MARPAPLQPQRAPAPPGVGRASTHRSPFYQVPGDQLRPGPANRHILALRSGIPEEVDWALPRLVTASFDYADQFRVSAWQNAASALLEWPLRWLEELRQAAALQQARKEGLATLALGATPQYSTDPATQRRATESLLIIRNASTSVENAKYLSRPQLLDFIYGFFALPEEFLLDTLLDSPEPVQHILVTLSCTFYYIPRSVELDTLFLSTLPYLVMHARDAGLLELLIPLINTAYPPLSKQSTVIIPSGLYLHLLHLLTLVPPSHIFAFILDLLVTLTIDPPPALAILRDSSISAHLKTLSRILEHNAKQRTVEVSVPPWSMGGIAPNPASTIAQVEEASKQRAAVRAEVQRQLQVNGQIVGTPPLGDRPPQIDEHLRRKLMTMQEPERSIAWMHESYVYSSEGQVLQVDFWHAYRQFFTAPERVEPLLTAADVIKNVTVSFPGTGAKVIVGPDGQNRFVIAGLGFRKDVPDANRNICRWESCTARGPYPALQPLIEHVRTHILPPPGSAQPPADRCHWHGCKSPNATLSHMLTHLPLPPMPGTPLAPPTVLSNPRSDSWIAHPRITGRSAPRLPAGYKIRFVDTLTPVDEQTRSPRGVPFLAALLMRNLARSLRNELDAAAERQAILSGEDTQGSEAIEGAKKKAEARYGLPIPDSVLAEEEEEAMAALKSSLVGADGQAMSDEERDRAKAAFMSVEEKVEEVVTSNRGGIGQYLGECWGW